MFKDNPTIGQKHVNKLLDISSAILENELLCQISKTRIIFDRNKHMGFDRMNTILSWKLLAEIITYMGVKRDFQT